MSELDDIIRQHLDDFYWEHVEFLEQQIIELGHKPKLADHKQKVLDLIGAVRCGWCIKIRGSNFS